MTYLLKLFRDHTRGYLSIFDKNTKSARWFDIQDIEEAGAHLLAAAEYTDIYFGWGLHEAPAEKGRGTANPVCAIPGFMLDVDVRNDIDPVHANNDELPTSWEPVRDLLLLAGFPAPTSVRHSGNGAYLDWILSDPLVIKDTEHRKNVMDISSRFQLAVKAAAAKRGWKLDNVGDLARVTRMPGCFNHKTYPPKPVRLLSCDESLRVSFDAFVDHLVEFERQLGIGTSAGGERRSKPGTRLMVVSSSGDQSPGADSAPKFSTIAQSCRWVASAVERGEKLPEPEWYGLAGIVGRCEDGRRQFHDLSSADTRYSEQETDSKLDHALKSGPRRCETIAADFGADECTGCPFRYTELSSPIVLGRMNANIATLMGTHVYDVSTGRYFDLETLRALDDKQFTNKFRHRFDKATPHAELIANRFTLKVERTDYLPGVRNPIVSDGPDRILNLWRASDVKPIAGQWTTIGQHIEYLIPDQLVRDHLLNMLAHACQRPAEKIRHVALIIGKQGTGKSFIGTLLGHIFGSDNTYIAESHDLNDGWTASMANRQTLLLEELNIQDKREVYQNLKRWLTDEMVTVNEKFVRKYQARTPRLILAFSNHVAPTNLEESDRRFFVIDSPAEPRDGSYYDRLFGEGIAEAPAFLHALLERDVSSFNPSAPPPMTESKANIIAWSRPQVTQEVEALMTQGHPPFNKAVVSAEDLRSKLSYRIKGRQPSQMEITQALKAVGAVQLPQTRLPSGARVRLWAWKDQERWQGAGPEEIRAEYLNTIGTPSVA